MKFLIQRVSNAELKVNNKIISKINQGLLVLIGIEDADTKEKADYLVNKLINLRIFSDENMKMNKSIIDISGELLLVSQFTLYADCSKGNRPSFINAGKPEFANEMYNYIVSIAKNKIPIVKEGIFGADMQINLTNDGPVTIMLEK